ncbi:MAG: SusC/RagA family TonB-linked outer membrane protein, partial [Bacteroidales bacterium]|nr:SusC/RagA family TonB-linked outer membrane protein [Bacteroidales bacterium]
RGAYRNEYSTNAIAGKVSLEYTVSDLKFRLALGMDNRTEQTSVFLPELGFATVGDKYRTSIQGYYDNMLLDTQFDVTYHKRFNYVHDFSAKAGVQMLNNDLQYRYGRSYNAASDFYTNLKGNRDSISSRSDVWRSLGMFGTFNYVYYDRYILNATARVDASSRFGAKRQAVLFPAVGAAWRVDREDFLRNSSVINELKLRASYGLTGNDNIGNYYARLLYQPSNYKDLGGFAINNLANEKLKPEINREFQAGVDLGFLANKITMTVDYFNTVNSNMIVFNNIKQTAGISGAFMNVGENTNKGLEAGVNVAFKTGQVKYNVGATFATVDTKVTKMPSATPYIENSYQGVFTARAQEGHALGSYYGYQTDGIYSTPADLISPVTGKTIVNGKNEKNQNVYESFQAGDVKFVDQNKDGIINDQDKVFLGDPNSNYYGSFRGDVSYKGFTLSALVDYQLGRDIVNGLRYELESQNGYANQTIAVNRRWRQAGDVTDMPRLSYGDPSGNNRFSDRWIEDGSFVRLRNVTLSYTLPETLTKKAYLEKVTFFVTGENLLTWTKYTGLDPEFNSLNDGLLYGVDGGSMPVTRSYSAGIRIGL